MTQTSRITLTRGQVAEGASSNLFIARDGGLATPPLDAPILPGLTRRLVLRLAANLGVEPAERPIEPAELRDADVIFLTSAIAEILPVRSLDSRLVGDGVPGPLTRSLHAAYWDAVRAASG